jgi:hypothetical protein
VSSCRRGGRALATAALTITLVLTSCDGADPAAALREAVERTATTDLAYELAFVDDPREDAGIDDELRAALASFRLLGSRQADGRSDLALDIGGTAPLLEVRVTGDEVLLRTGLGALLGIAAQQDPADPADDPELTAALDGLALDDEGRRALLAGFRGEWVALSDAGADGGGLDVDGLLADLEVLGAREVGEVTRYEVRVPRDAVVGATLRRAFGGALDELPDPLPALVQVRDGYVVQARFSLGAAGAPQALVAVLHLRDHGQAPAPDPVSPAARLTLEELQGVLDALDLPLAGAGTG